MHVQVESAKAMIHEHAKQCTANRKANVIFRSSSTATIAPQSFSEQVCVVWLKQHLKMCEVCELFKDGGQGEGHNAEGWQETEGRDQAGVSSAEGGVQEKASADGS